MNKNIIVTSDLHIHSHKKSLDRVDDCIRVLNWVYDTAKQNKINCVLFLGDLFHDHTKIDILLYQRTFETFLKWHSENTDLRTFLLIGNHDMYHVDRWDVNSIFPLSAIDGVTVVNFPRTIKIYDHEFDLLPYTDNPLQDLIAFSKKGRREFLGAHIAVDGAKLNSYGMEADVIVEHDNNMVKVDLDWFTSWNRVFLGHYHQAQKLSDNIEYVGSPLQLNFGEAFQKKHICIFNPDTNQVKYVVNDFSPQHIIIQHSEVKNHKLAGNFVRIQLPDVTSTEATELRGKLMNEGCRSFKLEQKSSETTEDSHVVSDAKSILLNQDEMIAKYVVEQESIISNMDKEKLITIGKEICAETIFE